MPVKIAQTIKDALGGDKDKKKGKDFMKGLGDWVTSPGGIATLILFGVALWYAHHAATAKK